MRSFSFCNVGYVGLIPGGETVPAGWLGPVAPTTQPARKFAENGADVPGSWGQAGGQPNTPSGLLIYTTVPGGSLPGLTTVAYAGGELALYAPGGNGAAAIRLVVTRQTTGEVLYDQTATENQVGDKSYLLHRVKLPAFAAWAVDFYNTGPVNLDRIEWT